MILSGNRFISIVYNLLVEMIPLPIVESCNITSKVIITCILTVVAINILLRLIVISSKRNYIERQVVSPFSVERARRYAIHPEEEAFPLAYSILVYTNLERVIRLLKSIHRPQNHYCIHVDKKTSATYVNKLREASHNLGNNIYFVPDDERVDVEWSTITVLEPEMKCARSLLSPHLPWKYWINLTGQEFPLRTNWELVSALRALNGTNLVEAVYRRRNPNRFSNVQLPNFHVIWYKGSVHIAVRREFIDYMLNNETAIELYNHLGLHSNISIPDEMFFATLNHNPETFPIPGAFLGEHEENVTTSIQRYKVWIEGEKPMRCGTGVWLREVCQLGFGDLRDLTTGPFFFANKLQPSVEPEAYDLLEAWIEKKMSYELEHGRLHPSFNLTYYAKHEFAWNNL